MVTYGVDKIPEEVYFFQGLKKAYIEDLYIEPALVLEFEEPMGRENIEHDIHCYLIIRYKSTGGVFGSSSCLKQRLEQEKEFNKNMGI